MGHEADKFEIPERIRVKKSQLPTGVVNAYVYGRLTSEQAQKVEQMLKESSTLQKVVAKKKEHRQMLKGLIPIEVPSINSRTSLMLELGQMTENTFVTKEERFWD